MAEDRAEGEEPAVAVGDRGAVEPGEGLEHGRVEVGDGAVAGQVVEGPLGQRVAGGQLGRGGPEASEATRSLRGDQAADGLERVGRRRRTAPLPRLGQVERGLEDHAGELRAADGLVPEGELGGRVEDPPAAVGEGERLRALGEELDLLVGAEHDADVARGPGRPGVRGVGPRRRGRPARPPSGDLRRPALDVDDLGEPALAVDEEEGPLGRRRACGCS